jgi:hypothetical protein
MNTSQTNDLTDPQPLTSQDLALIEALEENRFNIRLLINKIDPIHPAQRDIISLTRWARQPHINQAIDAIVDTHRELAKKADAHAHLVAKESLSHALAVAASMIPHFDTCPDDPQQAEAFSRHSETLIRETRLIARTLLKLSPPPVPPRPSRARSPHSSDTTDAQSHAQTDAPSRTDDSASVVNTSPDSNPSPARLTHARLNRNSRKPAFSPAEVAEILSALLHHEDTLKSAATTALTHTSITPPLPSSTP